MDATDRRRFLRRIAGAAGALLLGGCDRLSQQPQARAVLASAERLTAAAHEVERLPRRQTTVEEDLEHALDAHLGWYLDRGGTGGKCAERRMGAPHDHRRDERRGAGTTHETEKRSASHRPGACIEVGPTGGNAT